MLRERPPLEDDQGKAVSPYSGTLSIEFEPMRLNSFMSSFGPYGRWMTELTNCLFDRATGLILHYVRDDPSEIAQCAISDKGLISILRLNDSLNRDYW